MKRIFMLKLFVLISLLNYSQPIAFLKKSELYEKIKQNIPFVNNEISFILRATKTKSGLIAKNFNFKDTVFTHIGIGYFENDSISVLHVSDYPKNGKYLVYESLSSFLKDSSVYSFGIVTFNNKLLINEFKKSMEDFSRRKITFDYKFKLKNGEKYYCSEFCVDFIKYLSNSKLNFYPINKNITDSFQSKILETNNLIFYPVDFFYKNSDFKISYQCFIN